MDLSKLGIIFLIIIIPMAIAMNAYTNMQFKAMEKENLYDSKLIATTRDALKSYKINTIIESESQLSQVQMNQIEAAVSQFYNSMRLNFALSEIPRSELQEYVPAIVFTMYDGYYIYSPFTNITTEIGEILANPTEEQTTYGVKPYVYYSCKYRIDNDNDFIITYSLDNYIKITGTVKGQYVNKSGYLLSNITCSNPDDISSPIYYDGIKIREKEELIEYVKERRKKSQQNPGDSEEFETEYKKYSYRKVNGKKYYYDDYDTSDGKGRIFYFQNDGERKYQIIQSFSNYDEIVHEFNSNSQGYSNINEYFIKYNNDGYNYYKEAYIFTEWVKNNLSNLSTKHAQTYSTSKDKKIFEGAELQNYASNFNEERRRIIREAIEQNLSVAIANFNNYSANSSYNYQMPVLSEHEWDILYDNSSIISFLQGFNIKTKIYSGHTVIPNDETIQLVKEGNIYLVRNQNKNDELNDKVTYHSILHKDINTLRQNNGDLSSEITGISSLDFNQQTNDDGETFYNSRLNKPCFDCLITNASISNKYNGNYLEFLKELKNSGTTVQEKQANKEILEAYYTGLGRERMGMYKIK